MSAPTGSRRPDVRRAAVIGAGVMGAGLAAHLAGAGVDVELLDVKPDRPSPEEAAAGLSRDDRAVADRPARAGLEAARRASPAAFFAPRLAGRVRPGNVEDDLGRLADVDWVLEAVVERLDVKRSLYARLAPHLAERTLITSNTSGLGCAELAAALPPGCRARFAVTHFFNPPRYLPLVELVPAEGADPDAMAGLAWFLERRLGKGVVIARDTPNFIANRLGMHALMHAMAALDRGDFDVATLDALTGTLLGRPKSATFRTADLVGLDTILHVAANLHERLGDDPQREAFAPPPLLRRMAEAGLLGAKAGRGFYRKTREGLAMLDPATLEYVPVSRPELEVPRAPLPQRMALLMGRDDAVGAFVREHLGRTLHYAASCAPDIAHALPDVDRALRWGFGWRLGPFETWDALGHALEAASGPAHGGASASDASGTAGATGATVGGVAAVAAGLARQGLEAPPLVTTLLDRGEAAFYDEHDGERRVLGLGGERVALRPGPRETDLARRAAAGGRIDGCDDADLIDLGGDVACLAFRTKAGVLTPALGEFMRTALERVERQHAGLVVGNEAEHLSAGAHLGLVLEAARAGDFARIDALVSAFQQLNTALAACRRPVVLAPRGRTLGGACEMLMHAHGACAAAESYIGLVEVGAGLIPAGGGCTAWLRRVHQTLPPEVEADRLPLLMRALQTIAMGRVSTSALEARDLGYLDADDPIVMNPGHLLHDAARHVRQLADRHTPPTPPEPLPVLGRDGLAAMRIGVFNLAQAGSMSAHDAKVTLHVARVLCGGDGPARRCTPQELLDLEREAFVSLCGEAATQQRMEHLLATGKPLRN